MIRSLSDPKRRSRMYGKTLCVQDVLQGILVKFILNHEIAVPDRSITLLAQQHVRSIHYVRDPAHIRGICFEPPAERALDRRPVRMEFLEVEPSPKCEVLQGNRSGLRCSSSR